MDVPSLVLALFQPTPDAANKLADAVLNQSGSVTVIIYTLWRMEQRLSKLETMIDGLKWWKRAADQTE